MPQPSQNPRNQRDQLQPFFGTKVQIGLANFHYVCGWLEALEGEEVRVRVNGKPILIHREQIANIHPVPASVAEYFK